MANNRFNRQVTPKGYKAGGMTRKMGKKKSVLSEEGKRKIKSRMTGGDSTGILFPQNGLYEKRRKSSWQIDYIINK